MPEKEPKQTPEEQGLEQKATPEAELSEEELGDVSGGVDAVAGLQRGLPTGVQPSFPQTFDEPDGSSAGDFTGDGLTEPKPITSKLDL